jgi:hypothetical protein
MRCARETAQSIFVASVADVRRGGRNDTKKPLWPWGRSVKSKPRHRGCAAWDTGPLGRRQAPPFATGALRRGAGADSGLDGGAVGLEALGDARDLLVRKNCRPANRKGDRVEPGERFELLRPHGSADPSVAPVVSAQWLLGRTAWLWPSASR